MSHAATASKPWYREPWPWLLMAGPAAVLVAGSFTIWLAYSTSDGLVAQDYYKQGLAVNKLLKREATASRMGLTAQVELPGDRHRIVVNLRGARPGELRALFAHSTRAGHDLNLRLVRVGEGRYEAAVPQSLPPGRWNVNLEEPGGAWRLAGEWSGREDVFRLGS